MNQNPKSIVYLNFAPYENAGRILDFLTSQFKLTILFSFNFHKLNNKNQSNIIRVFKEGRAQPEIKLFNLPTPEAILFITLPIITILIMVQTLWYIFRLRKLYGPIDIFLSVNAFTSWIGIIIKKMRLVGETVFWVWDYYPPGYPDWWIRLARWGYWRFDTIATKYSDRVVFLNQRLVDLRQNIGVLKENQTFPVVPIGTNPGKISFNRKPIIGHLGVLKQSQGLDLLFDILPELMKKMPNLQIEIVGSGPDEPHFRERAKGYKNIKFYGFVNTEDKVDEILRSWTVGIATYIPDQSNPAYWTDPSKMKAYISQGVPVITTAIAPFSEEIARAKAGLVVDYFQPKALIKAIVKICQKPKLYKERAFALAKKYYYKDLYPMLFE